MKSPMMYIFAMILGVNIMQPVIASEHAEDASNSTMALLDFKNPGDLIDWRSIGSKHLKTIQIQMQMLLNSLHPKTVLFS